MRTSSPRRGFTLVELLVVIAIIGVLVGLLLPAVQSARESARRSVCQANIKQLALAMQNYESSRSILPYTLGKETTAPAGGGPPYDLTNRGRSWIAQVLPFIEASDIYNAMRFDQPLNDPANLDMCGKRLKVLMCPADSPLSGSGLVNNRSNIGNHPTAGRMWGTTNYKAVAGGNWAWGDHTGVSMPTGRWPNDTNGIDRGNGIICRNSDNQPGNQTALTDIRDGLSKTFAVGEAVPEWCQHTTWFYFNHTTATCGVPLNYRVGMVDLVAATGDWGRNYSFFSRHVGGGMFAMVDGATTFVQDQIDLTVYRRLATIAGLESTDLP